MKSRENKRGEVLGNYVRRRRGITHGIVALDERWVRISVELQEQKGLRISSRRMFTRTCQFQSV